jgi:hypothetical protein
MARIQRAFAVRTELDMARREAGTLEAARERGVALLGEAVWNVGAVPAAASAVAEQVRRLEAEANQQAERSGEIEAMIVRHDAAAGVSEGEGGSALAAAEAARAEAERRRDEAKQALDAVEGEIEALRRGADAADAAARAARAEADELGLGNLTAEERIRREAAIDEGRLAKEREAVESRSRAAALERSAPALREALEAAERLLSERAADRDRADVDLGGRRDRLARARAELAEALADVRARADRLRVDRARLLAALGSAAIVARPAHPTLDGLYSELGGIEARLALARTRIARLESESARLRAVRIGAVSAAVLVAFVMLLLVFVYALR